MDSENLGFVPLAVTLAHCIDEHAFMEEAAFVLILFSTGSLLRDC